MMSVICHQSWRDCDAWRALGVPMSTTSNEAAKMFDASLTQYVGWYDDLTVGGIEGAVSKMTEADPSFVLGKVMSIGLELMGTGRTTRLDSSFKEDVDNLTKLASSNRTTTREKKHTDAIKLWAEGNLHDAVYMWEEILTEHPLDMLAIKFAHDAYFYLGEAYPMRDSIARVFPHWKETMPLYGYLMGMHSFGLVETNLYQHAEKVARKGIAINPCDAWSTHSLAHVFEMEGRSDEGIAFMSKTVDNWSKCGMLASHNFWHWAVYHIDKGEHSAALDLLDGQMNTRARKSGAMLDIVDACSMLHRLEMEGVKVGRERWEDIVEVCRPHVDDHILLFNDLHLLMAFLGAKQGDLTDQFMNSLAAYAGSCGGTNQKLTKEVGLSMCKALCVYDSGDYAKATDLVNQNRYELFRMGGSNAQRDVFHQFLVHSAMKSSDPKHHKLARNLILERMSLRPDSKLNERLQARCLAMHGE